MPSAWVCASATIWSKVLIGPFGMPRASSSRAHPARYAVLLRDRLTGSALVLGHMPPERGYPAHVHLGPEDILVLTGGFEDQFGAFETGAWATYAPGSQHRPVTEPGEECWTLTRLEKPNLYLGWRGWLQRLQK